ncbi:S-layer homology domain-containing protein [Evtepia sp.]|uniref:S-layer homology domain-containing protein n=1 Tax=Evtepia sp. TaxID=2773933 RepID=UPI00399097F3
MNNTVAPYSYYASVAAAQAAAQSGDVVTDLSTVAENAKEFIVVFDYGDGTKKELTMPEGANASLPSLNDRGYNHFVGWTDQAGKHYDGGDTVTITANTTFTAQWSYIPPANPNYRITIGDMENGTVTANPTAAKAGATVTLTPVPDEDYALSTLTVTDRFGDAVRVTEQADGTYTFPMPNGQVTVNATFVETEEPVAEPFIDVAEGDWFYDAVVYAYQNELMDGVGGNRFAPNSETTRAQLVTILYRLEGEPAVSGDLPFTDVEAGIWYTDAILWAAQNNIVNGVSDTEFAPGDDLTRQQLVTILYRYAEAKGYDVSASADLSGYPDAGQVQDYAQPAMAWAVAENIIQGMEDGTLKPAGNASRAQIATILMRFCEDVAQ